MKKGVVAIGFVVSVFTLAFLVSGQNALYSSSPAALISSQFSTQVLQEGSDENNQIGQYENNFPEIDKGVIRLDKTITKISPTLISDVKWGEDDIPKEILFRNFKVKENLGAIISDENSLKSVAHAFLSNYKNALGIEGIELRLKYTHFPSLIALQQQYPAQRIATVFYQQTVRNPIDNKEYDVAGSFVVLVFVLDKDNTWRVGFYKSNTYPAVGRAEQYGPILSSQETAERARTYLGEIDPFYASLKIDKIETVAYPASSVVWADKIIFEKTLSEGSPVRYAVIIQKRSGEPLSFYNILRTEDITGRVSGSIYPETPNRHVEDIAFAHQDVVIFDRQVVGHEATTGEDGRYALSVEDLNFIQTRLSGPWTKVYDAQTSETIMLKRPAIEGYNINWKDYDTSYKQEQSNVFYHVNLMADFALQSHIGLKKGFFVSTFVNEDDTCNAYYDPYFKELHFFEKGPYLYDPEIICEATSLFSSVIYHEYGHGITHRLITLGDEAFPYEGETGHLDEGLSDYTACTVGDLREVQDPACIQSFVLGKEETCFRRCDTDDKYPNDYGNEAHAGAQIISGALWDMRDKMIAKFGRVEGIKKSDGLVYHALLFQPTSYFDYVEGMIIADDDNGNVDDGSQNVEEICGSFAEHGIITPVCGGFIDQPLAYIHAPRPHGEFFRDEFYDIVVTASPAKGSSLKEWVLSITDISTIEVGKKPIAIFTGTNPLKKQILTNFDFSKLEMGHSYEMKLVVNDMNSKEASYTIRFIKSRLVKIKVLYEPQESDEVSLSVYSRAMGGKRSLSFTRECDPLGNSCQIDHEVLDNQGDVIIKLAKGKWIPANSVFLFFKKYTFPEEFIEVDTRQTKSIQSNIPFVMENKKITARMGEFRIFHETSEGLLDFQWGWIKSPQDLFLQFDDDLYFRDYLIYYNWFAINKDEKRLVNLAALDPYPFSYDAFVDESKLQSIHINVFSPFKDKTCLRIIDYPLSASRVIRLNAHFGSCYDIKDASLEENYIYEYFPELEGIKIDHIFLAAATDWNDYYIAREFYNGFGKALWDAPETLSADVDIFKEPFEINVEDGEFEVGKGKTKYLLRGYLADGFRNARATIGDRTKKVYGDLTFTLPSGKNIEIVNFIGKKVIGPPHEGLFLVDCNNDDALFDVSHPAQIHRIYFCDQGTYKINWAFWEEIRVAWKIFL